MYYLDLLTDRLPCSFFISSDSTIYFWTLYNSFIIVWYPAKSKPVLSMDETWFSSVLLNSSISDIIVQTIVKVIYKDLSLTYSIEPVIRFKESSWTYLCSTCWTYTLYFPCIIIDAPLAKLMQTLFHSDGIFIDIEAYWTLNCLFQ